jgi:hypothetical protein
VLPSSVASTDAQGRYALAALPAGTFTLTASAPGLAPAVLTLTLLPATPLAGVDFVLPAVASLRGTVRGPDGTDVEGWTLRIQRFDADGQRGETRSTQTEAGGRFEFGELAPGRWHLHWTPDQELDLAPGEQRALELILPAPTGIAGRVVDADGVPVPVALVFLTQLWEDGRRASPSVVVCDAEGRFVAECAPGTVSVVAARSGNGVSALVEVPVVAQQTPFVELRLGRERAEVRVRDAGSHAPVPGVHVALVPLHADGEAALEARLTMDDWCFDLSIFTDAQGIARFPCLGWDATSSGSTGTRCCRARSRR